MHPYMKTLALTLTLIATGISTQNTLADNLRIISTDGASTEMLLAMGLDQSLVAIDVTSVVPDELSDLPSVGYHRALSAEGLMSLDPDIIVGSEHMGPVSVVEQLKAAGVEVIQLPASQDLSQLNLNIQQLASALDDGQEIRELTTELNSQQQQLKQQQLNGTKAVFILAAENRLRLAGRGTTGDALLRLMGAKNQADYDNYRSVTAEALLALQPEVIIIAGEGSQANAESLLQQAPMLSHTPAAKQGHIISADGRTLVAGIGPGALREALRITALLQGN